MPQDFGKLPTTNQPWSAIASCHPVKQSAHGIELECGEARVTISVLAANLIRVRLSPTGEFIPRREWAVTLDDAEWADVAFTIQETETTIEIITEMLRVFIARQNCRITCFDTPYLAWNWRIYPLRRR